MILNFCPRSIRWCRRTFTVLHLFFTQRNSKLAEFSYCHTLSQQRWAWWWVAAFREVTDRCGWETSPNRPTGTLLGACRFDYSQGTSGSQLKNPTSTISRNRKGTAHGDDMSQCHADFIVLAINEIIRKDYQDFLMMEHFLVSQSRSWRHQSISTTLKVDVTSSLSFSVCVTDAWPMIGSSSA